VGIKLPEPLQFSRAVLPLLARPRHVVVMSSLLSRQLVYIRVKRSTHDRRILNLLRVPRTESMQRRLGTLRGRPITDTCTPQIENRLLKTVSGLHLLPLIPERASPHISPEEGVLHSPSRSIIAIYFHWGLLLVPAVIGICVGLQLPGIVWPPIGPPGFP
jgi:hypothetical protein